MDNKAYLEQISAEARPLTAKKSFFGLSPKLIAILIGIVVAAFAIIIFGSILSSVDTGGNSERNSLDRIYLRTENLSKTISSYNSRVKSSDLRSLGTSLNALLSEANYQVKTYMKEVLGLTAGKTETTKIIDDETAIIDELNQTLENARLNGILDRTYAREFAYQIGMLISLEDSAISYTNNSVLKSDLETSRSSLDQLYTNFNNFSGQ